MYNRFVIKIWSCWLFKGVRNLHVKYDTVGFRVQKMCKCVNYSVIFYSVLCSLFSTGLEWGWVNNDWNFFLCLCHSPDVCCVQKHYCTCDLLPKPLGLLPAAGLNKTRWFKFNRSKKKETGSCFPVESESCTQYECIKNR